MPDSGSKTATFGSTARVRHDSASYYRRNLSPIWQSGDIEAERRPETPLPEGVGNSIIRRSSETMDALPDRSVHLAVTSPPYNVGKDYDQDLSVPEHLSLIGAVLEETYRVLTSAGRACVNIANIGRKPYIPLHSYIIELAAHVGFFMRGEIIWDKGMGVASTAWGSWMSPTNPTLRDAHEYILVFQKPPFGRRRNGQPDPSITRSEFLEYTKSIWRFAPESARRVGHPAPFPVELPRRLIELYTFPGDVVLDPFMGSGTTAVAAVESGRTFVGYEVMQEYIDSAMERVEAARPRAEIEEAEGC